MELQHPTLIPVLNDGLMPPDFSLRDAGDLALETATVAFAAWTIACQLTVALGGSAWAVTMSGGTAAILSGAAWGRRQKLRTGKSRQCLAEANLPTQSLGLGFPGTPAMLLTFVIALAFGAAFLVATKPLWAFVPGLAGLVLGLSFGFRKEPSPLPTIDCQWVTILCIVVAIGATAALNRPDADDAFYLGIANAVADRPDDPVLRYDTLHGVPGLEIHRWYHRLRTIEVLIGTAGLLTGIAPIEWAHRILPLLAAIGLVLAHRRLLRHLVPDRWPWALTATMVVLLTIGDAHGWYGNLALVRLHQGKGILVSVLVPFAIAAAIEFSHRPTPGRWILLAAIQVAAIGLNPTAIWLLPLIVWLSLFAGRPFNLGAWRTLLAGALTSIYPVTGGLLLLADLVPRLGRSIIEVSGTELVRHATELVLGGGLLPILVAFTVVVAWVSVPPGPGRRVLIVLPLALMVIFNPWAARSFAGIATGAKTFWRVVWMLPAPAMLAIVATSPLALKRLRPLSRKAATLMAVAACSMIVPTIQLSSKTNGVRIAPLDLRVPVKEGAVGRAIALLGPPGSLVLAPPAIGPWVTVWPHHPCPLMVRPDYLRFGSPEERRRRAFLSTWVSGPANALSTRKRFLKGLDHYRPTVVCIPRIHPAHQWWMELARSRDFVLDQTIAGYELWRPQHPNTSQTPLP